MNHSTSLPGAKTLTSLAIALMLAACGGGGGGSDDVADGGTDPTSPTDTTHTLTVQVQGLPEGATLPVTYGSSSSDNLSAASDSLAIKGSGSTSIALGKLALTTEQPYLVQCAFAEPLAGTLQADGSLQASLGADATQVVQCSQKIAVVLEQREVSVLPASKGSGLNVLTANLDGTQAQWLTPPLMVNRTTATSVTALMGNELFVSAKDDDVNSATGWELRATNGTEAGTRLVKDIFPGDVAGVGKDSRPTNLITLGGKVYFSASDTEGERLYASDGTEAGTQPVKFNGASLLINNPVAAGGKLFFTQRVTGKLLAIDSSGTVTDLGLTSWNGPVAAGDHIFIADENETQFISDGTVAGTKEFTAAAMASVPVRVGDWLYFYGAAHDETDFSQIHLWKMKPDYSGAQLVKAINASGASEIGHMANLNGTLVFSAYDGSKTGIYTSDGTAAGTKLLHTIKGSLNLSNYAVVNNHLIFLDREDRENSDYLWTTDGTAAGTQRLAAEGVPSFATRNTLSTGFQTAGPNRLVFLIHRGDANSTQADAWITDGTAAGTQKLQGKDGTAIDVLEDRNQAL